MTREEELASSVKELGKWLSAITSGGIGNAEIRGVLERARLALKMRNDHES